VLQELQVVEFCVPLGRWPVGTIGTIISIHHDGALIEISDDDGVTMDVLPVPFSAVRELGAPGHAPIHA